MTCAIVLIRISLFALEINFFFHPSTLLVIFSCKPFKIFTFDFLLTIGKPKYFSQSVILLARANMSSILCFTVKFL